jgi:hypothetical protein
MSRTHPSNPLIEAVRKNQPSKVSRLLDKLHDVNSVDENGTTSLVWSVLLGHTDCTRHLLTRPEIDINIANQWRDTAIFWAVSRRCTVSFWLLLDRPDINMNLVYQDGETVLTILIKNYFSDGTNSREMLYGCLKKGFYFEPCLYYDEGRETRQLLVFAELFRKKEICEDDLGLLKYFLESGVGVTSTANFKTLAVMKRIQEKGLPLLEKYFPPSLTQLTRNYIRKTVYNNKPGASPVQSLEELSRQYRLPVFCKRELLMQDNSYFVM